MKTICLLIAILLLPQYLLYAATDTTDTTDEGSATVDTEKAKLDALLQDFDVVKKSNEVIKSSLEVMAKKLEVKTGCVYNYKECLSFPEWLLVFTPIIIFIL